MHKRAESRRTAGPLTPRQGMVLVLALFATGFLLALTALLSPPLEGQAVERSIVFNQVTVTSDQATLQVEFDDGESLDITLREGQILADAEELGRYESGDALDVAWRSLLGQAVATDNGGIAELLRDWSPPSDLDEGTAPGARALEERLRSELRAGASSPSPVLVGSADDLRQAVESLILRTDRLRALTSAVRDLRSPELRIHVGEDVRIESDERVAGSLLVLDGDVAIEGELEGDLLLLGGSLSLGDEARIGGDLRWTDAEGTDEARDRVGGRVVQIQPVPDRPEADLRDEIQREVRAALGAETEAQRPSRPSRADRPRVLRNLVQGVGQVLQTLLTFGILFGVGLAALYFLPRHFEIVGRTARNAPGRSAVVGLATGILSFPIWVAGIVLLAITVIGIPVMLLWLPLFPLAVALAATVGFLAVARNAGEWAARGRFQGFDSLDASRPAIQLAVGLALLLAAFALAGVFHMGGAWLSIFHGLLSFIGVLLVLLVGTVGLGAVVLSRGGRDPLYAGSGWSWGGGEDPWAPEPDPFDADPDDPPPSDPWPKGRDTGAGEASSPAPDVDPPPESPRES